MHVMPLTTEQTERVAEAAEAILGTVRAAAGIDEELAVCAIVEALERALSSKEIEVPSFFAGLMLSSLDGDAAVAIETIREMYAAVLMSGVG